MALQFPTWGILDMCRRQLDRALAACLSVRNTSQQPTWENTVSTRLKYITQAHAHMLVLTRVVFVMGAIMALNRWLYAKNAHAHYVFVHSEMLLDV